MATSLLLRLKGLFTNYNELSSVPEGALSQAQNISILSENLVQPRRGFNLVADSALGDADDRVDAMFSYGGDLLAHYGTPAADTLGHFDGSTWTDFSGSFSAITGCRIKHVIDNQNLYITTSAGVKTISALTDAFRLSGGLKALDISSSAYSSGSFLADDYRTAYRVVWGYKDSNDNLILGTPSQRESYVNTSGGTDGVTLRITIPAEATVDWFFQIYRAAQVDNSVNATEPSDEMGLVYEAYPTAGELVTGYIDVNDDTPDELRGAVIYTAASQEGLANSNERPPLAKDIGVFRDSVFYANTKSKHRYTITLLAVGGTALVNDDTITFGGITYTGKATEDIAAAQFAVVTGGSASQNIRDTALSLVRVINRHASSTVYAYYLSSPEDLPGQILIEERGIGGASFALTSSNGDVFNPPLPTSGTSQSSTNDEYVNGLYFSKTNQPEHVPLANFITVGSKTKEILRVLPLRDSLVVLKEDGIFKVTGYYPNFNVDLIDSSAILIGKETPAVLNNVIYCMTTQGIVTIGDSVNVISLPIEDLIREKIASYQSDLEANAFGIAYEAERRYYLFWPVTSASTTPDEALVYNSFTRTFVTHNLAALCGHVDTSTNDLYLAPTDFNYILKERKTYTQIDHADYLREDTISSIDGDDIYLSSVSNLVVGDVIYQSSTLYSYITAIDTTSGFVNVDSDPGFTAAACTIFKAIPVSIAWVPVTFGNPAHMKQFSSVELMFKSDFNGKMYLYFQTDIDQNAEFSTFEGEPVGLWGQFNWGESPWGGDPVRRPYRTWVPRSKQRCSQLVLNLQHNTGFSKWELEGITVSGEMGTEKVNR